ncbi:hypothetical protein GTP81_10275 [Rugamonas sp. FT107W]|uniref:DUF3617 family protein n=1 Tax=Duganella vulcania TaxID=2692166 RepID=A0A845HFM4_9BURK|nr:hypothetical protein [Duganella vulcania]MYN17137.1 hypothetical protein [Duganella vulcania]
MKHIYSAMGAALFCTFSLCHAADEAVAPRALEEGRAAINYKSDGDGMIVDFANSTEAEACKGMVPVGRVYAAELLRKKLLGFIAKMVEKSNRNLANALPEIETGVKADEPLQIRGYSSYSSSNGPFRSSGFCGPRTLRFTPQSQHRYQVMFNFVSGGCEQTITDVTQPEQSVPVEAEVILSCPKP